MLVSGRVNANTPYKKHIIIYIPRKNCGWKTIFLFGRPLSSSYVCSRDGKRVINPLKVWVHAIPNQPWWNRLKWELVWRLWVKLRLGFSKCLQSVYVKMSSMYAPYKKQLAPETCDWLYYLYNFIITKGGALTVVRCHQFDGFHRHRLVALGSETDGLIMANLCKTGSKLV